MTLWLLFPTLPLHAAALQLAGGSDAYVSAIITATAAAIDWAQGLPAQLGSELSASLQALGQPGFRQRPLQQMLPVVRTASMQLRQSLVGVALHRQGMEPAAAAAKAAYVCSSAVEGDDGPTYPAIHAQRQRGFNKFTSPAGGHIAAARASWHERRSAGGGQHSVRLLRGCWI